MGIIAARLVNDEIIINVVFQISIVNVVNDGTILKVVLEISVVSVVTDEFILKYAPTNEFLDLLPSHMVLLHFVKPTRISTTSKTPIDKIFWNIYTPRSISSNLTSSISDEIPQFLIVPDIIIKSSPPKSNIYERDWTNSDQESFILDYLGVDMADIVKSENKKQIFYLNIF